MGKAKESYNACSTERIRCGLVSPFPLPLISDLDGIINCYLVFCDVADRYGARGLGKST